MEQYALLARTNRLALLGVRRTRNIGQDHEFEPLRDYTVDDNYKRIDWRATARRNKLTVRDFQATQCQQIVFLLDAGRLMTNESARLTLLDHSLNAMLMLSYVAMRQGDQVGLIHFADDVDCFVPPRRGMRQMNRLLHASFDRFPRLVETRYDRAFRYLNGHFRKRSLVILITSIIDEVNAAEFDRYLTNLVGRHLPLAVLLRDHRLFDAVAPEQPNSRQLWRYAAAADIIAWRHQVLTDLHGKGVLSLDVFPEQMTAPTGKSLFGDQGPALTVATTRPFAQNIGQKHREQKYRKIGIGWKQAALVILSRLLFQNSRSPILLFLCFCSPYFCPMHG